MTILGIANDETASACIIKDAELIAAASEERFTRVKMDNSWPENAINYCLSKACLLYTSPSPRDRTRSRMPSSA